MIGRPFQTSKANTKKELPIALGALFLKGISRIELQINRDREDSTVK
jgi:hypothetical protein